MNKKGFTMVELLAIMVILVIISAVAVPSVINITKKTENNDQLYDTIYMAAETYVYNNYDDFSSLNSIGGTAQVSVIDLINNNYLKNSIKNPEDNKKFTSDDYILVTRNENMTLSFEIKEVS